jgi:hypothetical protein
MPLMHMPQTPALSLEGRVERDGNPGKPFFPPLGQGRGVEGGAARGTEGEEFAVEE